jgi:hypothetical protein
MELTDEIRSELGYQSESRVFALGQCIHHHWKKAGLTPRGKQIRCCVHCGKSSTENGRVFMPRMERAAQIAWAFLSGLSLKETERATGLSHRTIDLCFAEIKRYAQRPPCGCGRPGGHREWCEIRREKRRRRLGSQI